MLRSGGTLRGAAIVGLLAVSTTLQADLFKMGGMKLPEGRLIDSAEIPEARVPDLPGAHIIPLRADADPRIFPAGATRHYLQDIVNRLQAAWPHPADPVAVHLSTSFFAPADYHAEACPDDAIIVYLGVIEQADTEDEVAFVVAHELAHVLLRHMAREDFLARTRRSVRVAIRLNRIIATLAALDFDRAAAEQAAQGEGEAVDQVVTLDAEEAAKKKAQALKLQEDFFDAQNDIFIPQWSRTHEDQADFLAIDLLTAAGYSPHGTAQVFQRLAEAAGQRQNRFRALMDRYRDYIDSLPEEMVVSSIEATVKDLSEGRRIASAAWNHVRGDLIAASRESVLARLRPSHRDPDKRSSGIRKYLTREYPETSAAENNGKSIGSVQQHPEFDRLLRARDAVLDSRFHLALNELDAGFDALAPATSGPLQYYGEGRWLKHKFRLAQDNEQDARANLVLADRGSHPGARVYEKLFAYHWAPGAADSARDWIRRGADRFADPQHFLPEQIFDQIQHERSADAQSAQCKDSVKDYLHAVCQAAGASSDAGFRDFYAQIYCSLKDDEADASDRKEGASELLETGRKIGKLFARGVKAAGALIKDDGC